MLSANWAVVEVLNNTSGKTGRHTSENESPLIGKSKKSLSINIISNAMVCDPIIPLTKHVHGQLEEC